MVTRNSRTTHTTFCVVSIPFLSLLIFHFSSSFVIFLDFGIYIKKFLAGGPFSYALHFQTVSQVFENPGASMASTVKSFSLSHPHFASNLERRAHSRYSFRCLSSKDSAAALSFDSVKVNGAVNGVSSSAVEEREKVDLGSNQVSSVVDGKRRVKEREEVKLEALWDDGYGTETVQDYLDSAADMIKSDGGPVRWFTPISCGPHLRGSPVLLFLPGKKTDS